MSEPIASKPKTVLITGITGMVGNSLAVHLLQKGYQVLGLSRKPIPNNLNSSRDIHLIAWNGTCGDPWFREAEGIDAIINLAGENIASGKWTMKQKKRILESRLQAVRAVQDAIALMNTPPPLLLQASASGFYGIKTPGIVDETSAPGEGFLSEVCLKVENEAQQTDNTQVVIIRLGTVLKNGEGALGKMTAPMKFGLGGYPFPGHNMVSWIHIQDLCATISHLLEKKNLQPVYNLTAPEPVSLKKLITRSARAKRIPISFPVPSLLMKMFLGKQMVEETLLANQEVYPANLLQSGFEFIYPSIDKAISNLFI